MPDSVEDAIVAPLHQASRVGWNDDAAALLLELFSQGGRVVSAVADHVGVADLRHQGLGGDHFMRLTLGQGELDWSAASINERVDLGSRSATGVPDRPVPPFRAR